MASTSRLPRHLRFGLLTVAAIFFANPIVAIIDPLPDCLGYLLLWFALGYVADLQGYLAEARRGFLRMALIDGMKLVGLLFLVTIPSAKEQPSTQLLLTFIFAVLELIYAIPAWSNLFDGLYNLISTNGDLCGYDLTARRRKNRPVAVRSLLELLKSGTVGWIIARAALTTLPEMTALSSFEHSGYVTNRDYDIYNFRGLFVFTAFVLMTILGIRWLIRMLRLCRRLYRDDALAAALTARYTAEILPDEGLFRRRRIRLGLGVATMACILSLDFYVEEMNIVPDALAALALIAALLILRRAGARITLTLWTSGIWAGVSVLATVCANAFHGEFYPQLVYKNSEAYAAYQLMCATTVLEQLAFAGTVVGFVLMLCGLIRSVDDMLWLDLRRRVVIIGLLGLLAAVSGVIYDLLLPTVEYIWLIDFSLGLLFAGYAWKSLGDISDAASVAIRDRLTQEERIEQHEQFH